MISSLRRALVPVSLKSIVNSAMVALAVRGPAGLGLCRKDLHCANSLTSCKKRYKHARTFKLERWIYSVNSVIFITEEINIEINILISSIERGALVKLALKENFVWCNEKYS